MLNRLPTTRFFIAFVLSVLTNSILAEDKAAEIHKLMQAYFDDGQFNGSVLVAERGEVIFKKGFGLANREWDIANEPNTRFRIGSITKQFTAMLIMQLVAEGKINLDEKVTTYLPDYRKDTGDEITVHHLLTHTSGIPNYTALPHFFEQAVRNSYAVDEFIKQFCSGDLEFEVGTQFTYSNSGYFLLGVIIERLTGETYEAVLQRRILDPLKMSATGYDRHEKVIANRAAGYERTDNGFQNGHYWDESSVYSAGAIYSTVEDLYLWDRALYTEQLLSDEHKEIMFTPFLNHYAYGWIVREIADSERGISGSVMSHDGAISGFHSSIFRNTNDQRLIVMLNNTGFAALSKMAFGIASILEDKPYDLPEQSAPIAQDVLQTYVGQYQLAPTFFIEITHGGEKLLAQATGQQQFQIFPQSENKFFLKAVDAQITFNLNDEGEVEGLTLHQNGQNAFGKRVE